MKKKFLVPVILLPLLFAGCLSDDDVQKPTFISPAPTFTSIEQSIQIIVTETAITAPTPTNLPPVSNETRKNVLTNLVQANGGCQLPCILGLTPGTSNQLAVTTFMRYFQVNSREAEDQINNISIATFSDKEWSGADLRFFENRVNVSVSIASQIMDGKVERVMFFGQAMQLMDVGAKKLFGDPYYDDLLQSFSLSNILEVYGRPEQIIIRPFPDDLGHPSPPAQYTFDFVLFYPKQGFVAEYISVRAEEGGNFIGCPTKSYITRISSWNPAEAMSLAEAIKYFSNLDGISETNISEYKQLQDVTSLSLTEFYNVFRTSNTSNCIKTPKDLWASATQ